jgi:hypothetical protein
MRVAMNREFGAVPCCGVWNVRPLLRYMAAANTVGLQEQIDYNVYLFIIQIYFISSQFAGMVAFIAFCFPILLPILPVHQWKK